MGRMKFFAHPDLDQFKRDELDGWFAKVVVDKPKESRSGACLILLLRVPTDGQNRAKPTLCVSDTLALLWIANDALLPANESRRSIEAFCGWIPRLSASNGFPHRSLITSFTYQPRQCPKETPGNV
jgi:hypothetical protein